MDKNYFSRHFKKINWTTTFCVRDEDVKINKCETPTYTPLDLSSGIKGKKNVNFQVCSGMETQDAFPSSQERNVVKNFKMGLRLIHT